jgi:threonine dehydrogenase-like Zn-dependent dehydrogenase
VNSLGGPGEVNGKRLAVIGCGTLGLMAVRLAVLWGAEVVAASDLNPARLAVARGLGAVALPDVAGSQGSDMVLDMVGSDVTRRLAIAHAGRGSTVKFVGLQCGASEVPFGDVISRELTLIGVYAYTPAHFDVAAGMISRNELKLEDIVTRAPLVDGPAMFERLARDPQALVKVVLQP